MSAHIELRTIRGRSGPFERAFLFCPEGHEVVSAPVETTATGRRLADGDWSGESCYCGWAA